jgi:NCAIR mutase (PurE)-related protein
VDPVAKLDLAREGRTGIPEVILAEGKLDAHLVAAATAFAEANGRALVSRLAPERLALFEGTPFVKQYDPDARFLVLAKPGRESAPRRGGRVLVLAAGTADVAVAEEARLTAEALGCETRRAYDVGVAGIHRLYPELDHAEWSDVIIVAAGREGALATVVSGLVDRPVIGLPVSVGYGHGGKGEAALSAMLQACSPLLVVNIDAGVVAGACAAQIANRVARARQSAGESGRTAEETLAAVAGRE